MPTRRPYSWKKTPPHRDNTCRDHTETTHTETTHTKTTQTEITHTRIRGRQHFVNLHAPLEAVGVALSAVVGGGRRSVPLIKFVEVHAQSSWQARLCDNTHRDAPEFVAGAAFFFHEYGRRVGMVPRSSLKGGKNSLMVEKRTRKPNTTQNQPTPQPRAHRPCLHHHVVFPLCKVKHVRRERV